MSRESRRNTPDTPPRAFTTRTRASLSLHSLELLFVRFVLAQMQYKTNQVLLVKLGIRLAPGRMAAVSGLLRYKLGMSTENSLNEERL